MGVQMSIETRYCPVRDMPCPIEPKIEPSSPVCFIAIPHGKGWSDTRNTIKAVLESNNIFPYVAMDDVTAGRDILCKICERIYSSTFGVIELTERNPNVMFEFGLILGSQKPVFILYNKTLTKEERLPADIIALERIEYENQNELRQKFSRGLNNYLGRKERQQPSREPTTVVSSEEIDLLLKALKDSDDEIRLLGSKELFNLCYSKQFTHEKSLTDAMISLLNDPVDTIRLITLDTLRQLLLWRAREENKTYLLDNSINGIRENALHGDRLARVKAIRFLGSIKEKRAVDFLFEALENTEEDAYLEAIASSLKDLFYTAQWVESVYSLSIRERLFGMLRKPKLRKRAKIVFDTLHR